MKRSLFFGLLSIFAIGVNGQTIAYVTDTVVVRKFVWGYGDTTYSLKSAAFNYSCQSLIIYYDTSRKQKAREVYCYSDKRSDERTWYRNGQPKKFELNNDSLSYYRKDIQWWYPNGQMQLYSKTTRDSSVTCNWFSNGQLHYKRVGRGREPWQPQLWSYETNYWHGNNVHFKKEMSNPDSSWQVGYHPNGQMSSYSVHYLDSAAPKVNQFHFLQCFHDNGQPSQTPLFPARGKQPITYFYPSGKKKAKCDWHEGNIGPYKEWHENGKIKAKGKYIIAVKEFPHLKSANYYPEKSGHWIYYNEKGQKEREEWYAEDHASFKFKTYDEKGKVITEGEEKVKLPEVTYFIEN